MEPFKNLVSTARIATLATRIGQVHASFDTRAFRKTASAGLDALELKDRVRQVAGALRTHLPSHYPEALGILLRALEETPTPADDTFGLWPVCHFVEAYGVGDFDVSMRAMPLLTQHFTCEFAVRPFLLHDPARSLRHVKQWITHDSDRVRRLATEGIRPRLPWGQRLPMFQADPAPVIEVLDRLYRDESEFVRRSVANNINDISKDHPASAIATVKRWGNKPGPHFERLQHHALRTLLKQGDVDALALRGYGKAERITADLKLKRKRVALGDALTFSVELHNGARKAQAVMVDYALHFRKADGTLRPKVFKWTQRVLEKGGQLVLERAHALKAVTVRRYYAGVQEVEIFVNGRSVAREAFTLRL